MKRIGNIWNKIISLENLRLAHQYARRDKTYYREVKMVDANVDLYMNMIRDMLINHTYTVSDYTESVINDRGKSRTLRKLRYYPDRIIQWAIMLQLESTFVRTMCSHVCASMPGRGIHRAVMLVRRYLRDKPGTKYCAKLDVRKFYDNIDHNILKSMLRHKIKDKKLLRLLDLIIDSYPGDKGVPIGSYLSQYFANFFLSQLDHFIKEQLHVHYVVRYMDDIVIFGSDKTELHYWVYEIGLYLMCINLELKDNHQVFPVDSRGLDFVGYRFFHRYTLLRKATAYRIKRLCVKCADKISHGMRLNYKQWCAINSYIGWLMWCDSWRLFGKYIMPLIDALCEYYVIRLASHNISRVITGRKERYRTRLLRKRGKAA